ncbi:MAG: hypothetical protein KGM24_11820 [Elusimicrobia bacterium]|nr:hypothetical protein [Elusimicrobiota bacterium]
MRAALAAALLTPAGTASACSVCFGAVDAHLRFFSALSWAIIAMLATALSLIGGIAWTIWSIDRKRKDA